MRDMALQRSLFVRGLLSALVFLHLMVISPDEPFLDLEPFETSVQTCESEGQSFSSTNRSSFRPSIPGDQAGPVHFEHALHVVPPHRAYLFGCPSDWILPSHSVPIRATQAARLCKQGAETASFLAPGQDRGRESVSKGPKESTYQPVARKT